MGTGFGTGSAAPWSGDTSIKSVSALFSNTHSSLDMGGLNTQEQQALVEAAAQVREGWGWYCSTSYLVHSQQGSCRVGARCSSASSSCVP